MLRHLPQQLALVRKAIVLAGGRAPTCAITTTSRFATPITTRRCLSFSTHHQQQQQQHHNDLQQSPPQSTTEPSHTTNSSNEQHNKGLRSVSRSTVSVVGLSPGQAYDRLVHANVLQHDDHQRRIVSELDRLYFELQRHEPPIVPFELPRNALAEWKHLLKRKLLGSREPPPEPEWEPETLERLPPTPRGLYLEGTVGTGKTFLMDLLFNAMAHVKRKRRVHFHAFMLDVHRRVHLWKKHRQPGQDPSLALPCVAHDLAKDAWFLCFDEFQVTDIGDAMILYRLFFYLFKNGVVLVTTSNRLPDDLYKNGIQRDSFLPFIAMLKAKTVLVNLNSGIDYRLTGTVKDRVYFWPLSTEATNAIDELFAALTQGQPKLYNGVIHLPGRELVIPEYCGPVAKFSFRDLCLEAKGAADFIAISERFHTVIITDIPRMSLAQKVEAKRFLVLLDALYEQKVKLVCTADGPADQLFGATNSDVESEWRKQFDTPASSSSSKSIAGDYKPDTSLFSTPEEVFQFGRAVSRLMEMQSSQYLRTSSWKAVHSTPVDVPGTPAAAATT